MQKLGRRSIQSGIFLVVTAIVTIVLIVAVALYLLTTARTLRAAGGLLLSVGSPGPPKVQPIESPRYQCL